METNEQKQSTKAINNNTYIMFINMKKEKQNSKKNQKKNNNERNIINYER